MDTNAVGDFSMKLIHRAENDCAENDPDMVSAAAMVLVGDVYALLVCNGSAPDRPAAPDTREREIGLSPFIR